MCSVDVSSELRTTGRVRRICKALWFALGTPCGEHAKSHPLPPPSLRPLPWADLFLSRNIMSALRRDSARSRSMFRRVAIIGCVFWSTTGHCSIAILDAQGGRGSNDVELHELERRRNRTRSGPSSWSGTEGVGGVAGGGTQLGLLSCALTHGPHCSIVVFHVLVGRWALRREGCREFCCVGFNAFAMMCR